MADKKASDQDAYPAYAATDLLRVHRPGDTTYKILLPDAWNVILKQFADFLYIKLSNGEGNIQDVEGSLKFIGDGFVGFAFETSATSKADFGLFEAALNFTAYDKGTGLPGIGFAIGNDDDEIVTGVLLFPGVGDNYAAGLGGGVAEFFGITREHGGVTKIAHVNPASAIPSVDPTNGDFFFSDPADDLMKYLTPASVLVTM